MRSRNLVLAIGMAAALAGAAARAQTQPGTPAAPVRISLDDAVRLALQHNHALAAARTNIQQSQADEITANLRPNPVLMADAQFLPVFHPNRFNLRPIVMTAMVACLGLLPAALSHGIGSDTQRPFAIVVVAGLISRLFLGFFVNQVLYQVVAREGDVLQV